MTKLGRYVDSHFTMLVTLVGLLAVTAVVGIALVAGNKKENRGPLVVRQVPVGGRTVACVVAYRQGVSCDWERR